MEQSHSWKTKSYSASQKIPHILWNPNVHYRVHKGSPLEPDESIPHTPSLFTFSYYLLTYA